MLYGRLTVNPISAAWNTVARFDDYADAQQAVDRLSDDGFPVEHLEASPGTGGCTFHGPRRVGE